MKENTPTCARCPYHWTDRLCNTPDGKGLASCPTEHKTELLAKSMRVYEDPEILKFAQAASIQEGQGYQRLEGNNVKPVKPRILEIAEFAEKMGYRRLGLMFCEGLSAEAKAVDKFFRGRGFEMVSIVCKAGRTPKEDIGIKDEEKILPGTLEPMCNPVFQAHVMNAEKVEFAILMGLCVGHDSLVIQHLEAPVTVLAAKDRVTGHNPLGAVYTLDSYYAFLK